MPASQRPRRSALYIPGSNYRGLDKGRSIAADVLLLDLEDAVLPEAKKEARAAVAAAVGVHAYGTREVVVRVNGLDTPWVASDIAAVASARPDAILIPKVSRPEDIRRARAALAAAQAPRELRLWAMIETPLGVLNAQAIAASAPGPGAPIDCLVIGTNDLCKETGTRIQPGRALMLPWLAQVLAAGRAYNLAVLDGTHNDLDDRDGFRAECEHGRDLGMDGKTLIHPKQVPIANEVFSPSTEDIAWAKKVIAAFRLPENANKGVIMAGGRMLERLHERMARRILETAEQIEAIGTRDEDVD
jgi:citrate lyase subunit beta/citryl-CoA lyase